MIQEKSYWGTLRGTASSLASMQKAQGIIHDNMVYGTSASKLKTALSGISDPVISALVGIPTVGAAALTISSILGDLNSQSKKNNALIMTRGKYVLDELEQIVRKNTNYSQIEATVYFREFYNLSTGKKFRVVYGNSVPSDPKNNQQTGAFVVKRIQLKNGNWITQ